MKYVLTCLALLAVLPVATSTAEATTCASRASTCQRVGGGGACQEPYRLASCRKTGVYTAPNGKTQEAKDR
jgi:hypothetical protein